jgi:hypothetical protein
MRTKGVALCAATSGFFVTCKRGMRLSGNAFSRLSNIKAAILLRAYNFAQNAGAVHNFSPYWLLKDRDFEVALNNLLSGEHAPRI